jgi:hypothetical protein
MQDAGNEGTQEHAGCRSNENKGGKSAAGACMRDDPHLFEEMPEWNVMKQLDDSIVLWSTTMNHGRVGGIERPLDDVLMKIFVFCSTTTNRGRLGQIERALAAISIIMDHGRLHGIG